LAIFEVLADFLDRNFEDLKVYDLPGLVQVTRRNLMNEIDFTNELRNMKIARSFADETDIYILGEFAEYSSDKVLVMEFVNGNNFKEITVEQLSMVGRSPNKG
jgi:predicted unusual protein kinase regulating ubiquinone biosynthesis (AarF/ABC1/UbiB family)